MFVASKNTLCLNQVDTNKNSDVAGDGDYINQTDDNANLPIHVAAKCGLVRICRSLCDLGVGKNNTADASNKEGVTPLMLACGNNHPEVARLLLTRGAKVTRLNSHRRSALHYAVEGRSEQCAEIVLSAGANVNARDDHRDSALALAVRSCQVNMVELIVKQRGANVQTSDVHGRSALHWAVDVESSDVCRTLVEAGADLDALDVFNDTAFMLAVKKNNVVLAKELISYGCDRHCVDGLNGTPLTLATFHGLREMVSLLLNEGEDPNELSFLGVTPLTTAVYQADIHLADLLLDSGADPNYKTRYGKSPLAAVFLSLDAKNDVNRHQIFKLLVRRGADVNVSLDGLDTALCSAWYALTGLPINLMTLAIATGYVSAVKMLLLSGYRVTKTNLTFWKSTAFTERLFYDTTEIMKVLTSVTNKPLSLKQLSRQVIRAAVAVRPDVEIKRLPTPRALTDYLELKELDDVTIQKPKVKLGLENKVALIPLDVRSNKQYEIIFQRTKAKPAMANTSKPCWCHLCEFTANDLF